MKKWTALSLCLLLALALLAPVTASAAYGAFSSGLIYTDNAGYHNYLPGRPARDAVIVDGWIPSIRIDAAAILIEGDLTTVVPEARLTINGVTQTAAPSHTGGVTTFGGGGYVLPLEMGRNVVTISITGITDVRYAYLMGYALQLVIVRGADNGATREPGPNPSATVAPPSEYIRGERAVTTKSVTMYEGFGPKTKTIGTLPAGKEVYLQGWSSDNKWVAVLYQDAKQLGWIDGTAVKAK